MKRFTMEHYQVTCSNISSQVRLDSDHTSARVDTEIARGGEVAIDLVHHETL